MLHHAEDYSLHYVPLFFLQHTRFYRTSNYFYYVPSFCTLCFFYVPYAHHCNFVSLWCPYCITIESSHFSHVTFNVPMCILRYNVHWTTLRLIVTLFTFCTISIMLLSYTVLLILRHIIQFIFLYSILYPTSCCLCRYISTTLCWYVYFKYCLDVTISFRRLPLPSIWVFSILRQKIVS